MRGDANESVSIGVEHLLDHTHVVLIHCLDAVEALRSTRKYTALKRLVKVVRFVTRYIPYYNTSYFLFPIPAVSLASLDVDRLLVSLFQ